MDTCPHCGASLGPGDLQVLGELLCCVHCRAVFKSPGSGPQRPRQGSSPPGRTLTTSTLLSGSVPVPAMAPPDEPIEVVVRVLKGPHSGQVFRATGAEIIVGRGSAHINLDDDEVSRQHLMLQGLEGRCLVRDLDTTNGTFVDGLRVAEAYVEVGQELALGSTVLRLEAIRVVSPGG